MAVIGAELRDQVIVNPLSGERITIWAAQPDPAALAWELVLAPGGKVPAGHSHPRQQERFTVLEGRMRFRVGGRLVIAGPGGTITVPPGTAHHFANAGPSPARVAVRTSPPLGMRALLEVAAALAWERHLAGHVLPRPLDLILFMRDFEPEVAAPALPGLVRLGVRVLAAVAARSGPAPDTAADTAG